MFPVRTEKTGPLVPPPSQAEPELPASSSAGASDRDPAAPGRPSHCAAITVSRSPGPGRGPGCGHQLGGTWPGEKGVGPAGAGREGGRGGGGGPGGAVVTGLEWGGVGNGRFRRSGARLSPPRPTARRRGRAYYLRRARAGQIGGHWVAMADGFATVMDRKDTE